jgi:competence protein ComEC
VLILVKSALVWIDSQFAEEIFNFSIWFVLSFAFGIVCFFGAILYQHQVLLFLSLLLCGICFFIFSYRYLGIFIIVLGFGLFAGFSLAHFRYFELSQEGFCGTRIISVSGSLDSIRPINVGKRKDMKVIVISDCKSDKFLSQNRVSVYCKSSDLEGLEPGDLIKVCFKAGRQKRKILPIGYDFSLQNLINRIDLSGYLLTVPELVCKGGAFSMLNYLRKIRHQYYQIITSCLHKDEADFAAALIIGESQGLNREIMSHMRCAGLSHVLCVSGLHLTLIAGICFVVLRLILNSINFIALSCNVKVVAALLSWFASAFYWMLSGMNVATTRAFIMTSVGIAAVVLDRKACSFRTLTLAMFIVLCVNPADMMSVSFQLSFGSVLALIGGYNLFGFIGHTFTGIFGKFCSAMIANFYSSLVVSCITAPIAVYNFYVFSVYQILGNMAVLPVVSVFLMPMTVLAIVAIPLGGGFFILKIMAYGINFVTWVAESISYFPFSLLYIGHISWISVVVYVIGICWLLLWRGKLRFFGIALLLVSILGEMSKEKAEVLFDADHYSIGINDHGYLTIYGDKCSPFLQRYWTDWFGQRNILHHKFNTQGQNFYVRTSSGLRILVASHAHSQPLEADLVISITDDCTTSDLVPVIGRKEFQKLGNFVIYRKGNLLKVLGTKSAAELRCKS